jgi:hypothetical protein
MSIPKQIIGEMGDLGREIIKDTAKAPADLLGKALESIGTSSNPQHAQGGLVQTILGGGGNTSEGGTGGSGNSQNPFQQMKQANSQQTKAAIARSALEYLTTPPKQKEQSIFEKQKMEEEQKKEMLKKQNEMQAKQTIQMAKPKPKRGALFAAKKQSNMEQKQNVKSG